MRLGLGCTGSQCFIGAQAGQHHPSEEMIDFASSLVFEPLAFNRNFLDVPVWGPDAPYAIVFQGTKKKFYYAKDRESKNFSEFITYHTPNKVFPDFSGRDVWVLDGCVSAK